MDQITLYEIRVFLTVAEFKNFTKAAAILYTTQPTISKSIQHLEKKLGFVLFQRTSKQVNLTPAGEYLYENYKTIYHNIQKTTLEAYTIAHGVTTSIQVGALVGNNYETYLSEYIHPFEQKHPDIPVSFGIFGLYELVQNAASLDIVLSNELEISKLQDFTFTVLDEFPLYAAVSIQHPFAKKESVSMSELATQNQLILGREYTESALPFAVNAFQSLGLEPKFTAVKNLLTLVMQIAQNKGVSIVNCYMTRGYESEIILKPILDFPLKMRRVIGIRKEPANVREKMFLEYVVQETRKK